MITDDELETIVRNWNPEIDSINILKEAFEAYGKTTDELCEDDRIWNVICYTDWAEKYAELSFNTPFVERNNIMTIDIEGNCLCYDFSVNNISNLI
jgi:hypothetical protein